MEFSKSDFTRACELYAEWNAKINVVSRKDIDNLYEHHILHSLSIAEYMERNSLGASSILDVGTGGGFPGIPLAMAMPSCRFTLCDSIAKKILVASSVAEGLGLENVECRCCRAETITEKFDWVVSRAVTSLDNFFPWVKGRYTKGILYLKGGDVNDEISLLCRKFGILPSSIRVWPVSEWLHDEYFAEKFVIDIRK